MARQIGYGALTVTDVTDGINNATVYLYHRFASVTGHTPPANNKLTYNFTTGKLTGATADFNGWSQTIPNGDDPLYVVTAVATSIENTYIIPAWNDEIRLVVNGEDGQDGDDGLSITGVRELYYFKSTSDATPSRVNESTTIYTDTNSGHWTSKVPAYKAGGIYYTCIETTLSDNSKAWSDVAVNQALTDANNNAAIAKSIAQANEENAQGALAISQGLESRLRYIWVNLNDPSSLPSDITNTTSYLGGTYAASGIDGTTFVSSNPSTYGWNSLLRHNKLMFRYNGIALTTIGTDGLKLFAPIVSNNVVTGHQLSVELIGGTTSGALNFYNPKTGKIGLSLNKDNITFYKHDSTTAAATLNGTGLNIVAGGIKGGSTSDLNKFVYASTEDFGSNFTVNGHTATDWRLLVNNKFGVDKAGHLYASGAVISGTIEAGSGSNILTSVTSKDQYYLSTSSSSATGGSWQDTVPTWSSGKYIWTRVATTKTTPDGDSIAYSTGVYDKALTDALSTASSAQSTANSAASSVVTTKEYNLSSSTSTANGTWSTTVPTWAIGKYIWIRFKIVKTPMSGTATTSYSPSVNGQYDSALTTALSTATDAKTTANNAAPKSSAIAEEQRIYYRSNSNTKPNGNGLPMTWVTETGNKYNTNATTAAGWSRKITPISTGTSDTTKYLYLWTCIQKKTVSGTVTYGDILLDDSTTVIDGGKIITGSIDANKINVTDLNAFQATIGGFQIETSSIHTKNVAVTSNADNSVALSTTDFTRTISSKSRSGLRLAIGDKFAITGDGTLYAGGWIIDSASIYKNSDVASGTASTQYQAHLYAPATIASDTIAYRARYRSYDGGNNSYTNTDGTKSSYSGWTTPFYVRYDGYLYANNANIGGTITAKAGSIAGFHITSTAKDDTTANGGHVYTTSLYRHSGDGSTYEYEVGIKGDGTESSTSTTNTAGNLAFYIKRISKGAKWSTATNIFYVTHGGYLYAQSAEITGKITANSGKIGGWNIGTDTNKSLYYGNQTPGATTTNLVLSSTSATNTTAIAGSGTGKTWFISAGRSFGVDTAGKLYATGAVISGALTATSLTIDGTNYASDVKTISGKATTGYVDTAKAAAEKTATSYIANINSNDGITIKAVNGATSGSDNTKKNYIKLNGDGLYIYQGGVERGYFTANATAIGTSGGNRAIINSSGLNVYQVVNGTQTSVANFGDSARIGRADRQRVVIEPSGIDMYGYNANATTTNPLLCHIGFASGNAQSGQNYAPYYTFGTRLSDSPIGNWSMAEGISTKASGYASHAEGGATRAEGNLSHAEGQATLAQGSYSHAEGSDTYAMGTCSHACGCTTYAVADYSYAGGYYTTAEGKYQTVIGKYNSTDTTSLFIIGKGTSSTPSNALKVDGSGNLTIAGTLTLSGHSSPIGSILTKNGTKSIAKESNTYVSTGVTISLPAGSWAVTYSVSYPGNNTGNRAAVLYYDETKITCSECKMPPVNAAERVLNGTMFVENTTSSNKSATVYTWSTATSALTATVYMRAIRIA